MAEQLKPNPCDAWIRVDFGALVSAIPAPGSFAGMGYSLYVKEDGGDGTIVLKYERVNQASSDLSVGFVGAGFTCPGGAKGEAGSPPVWNRRYIWRPYG